MLATLPDALGDALGRVVSDERRKWLVEMEAMRANHRAELAEFRLKSDATIAELRGTVEAAVALVQERLVQVKDGRDGEPGKDADPDVAAAKAAELVLARLPPPEKGNPGKDADPEAIAELVLARMPAPEKGDAGKDADPEVICAMVNEAVAALPAPKNGEDGQSVTIEDVLPLVEEVVQKTISGLPPALDGKDADPEAVAQIVLARIPTPENGKDADPEAIAALVFERMPAPQPGRDGQDADPEIIVAMVSEAVAKAFAVLSVPKDGKDGVGLAGALIDRDGCLVITMTDGMVKHLGVVVGRDGDPGKAGADGLSIEDLSAEFDGERTLTLRLARGEVVKEIPVRFPIPLDRGIYKESNGYLQGDGVTYGGSFWIAQKDAPEGKPDAGNGSWRLAVKHGRDGKPGDPGKPGKEGEPGRPGRDFVAGKL